MRSMTCSELSGGLEDAVAGKPVTRCRENPLHEVTHG